MNAKKILAVLSFMLIAIFLTGCNQVPEVVTPDDLSLQKRLNDTEILGLTKMIWEEKLARDVYTTLGANYGTVFSNIAVIEQQHMNSLIAMLINHSPEPDPTIDANFPYDFQILYDNYIQVADLTEALNAGIAIETSLKSDYEYEMTQVSLDAPPGLTMLYDNLYEGSDNHLLAFEKLQ